jgi:adenylate cyclase
MLKNIRLLTILSYLLINTAFSQNKLKVDSLQSALTSISGKDRVDVLKDLAWELRKSDHTSAFKYLEEGMDLAEDLKYWEGLVDCIAYKGIILRHRNNFKSAMYYYMMTVKISQDHGYSKGLAYAFLNISDVLNTEKNYKQAMSYSKQSLALFQQLNDLSGLAYVYIRMGEIFRSLQQNDSALVSFKKCLTLRKQTKDTLGMATVLNRLGSIYAKQKNYTKAMICLNNSQEYQKAANNNYGIVNNIIEICHILFELKEYDKLIDEGKKGLELSRKIHSYGFTVSLAHRISLAYEAKSDFKAAYEFQKIEINAGDSLMNDNLQKEISKLHTEFEMNQQKTELELLNKDKKLKEEELKFQKYVLIFVSLVLVLILILVTILLKNNKQKTKTNRLLSDINKEIEYKNEALAKKTDELNATNEELNSTNEALHKTLILNSEEREKSEKLLRNILPESVSQELKNNQIVVPKLFEQVSILFIDFVDFTIFAERNLPEEIVKQLDYFFQHFDNLCKEKRMEKIKTIGDCYMAVGGLPEKNETNAIDAVETAMEMLKIANAANWNVRIGIHSGSVSAGVIGKHKFAYDIWGDAVNIAARMEQKGEINKINISEATFHLIHKQFSCTHRGKIEAKNKGLIDMYFVNV